MNPVQSIRRLLRGTLTSVLVLGLVASCSKPPKKESLRTYGGSGDSSTDNGTGPKGNAGSATSDGTKVDPSTGLAFNLSRLEPLNFRSLLSKLAFIADADPKKLDGNPAFASLLNNRFNLGDYDFARRSPGHSQWEVTQMNLWMTSLVPYCQNAALKTKYKSDVKAFIKAALGRDAGAEELALLEANSRIASNASLKFEAACVGYLTSLEFRNQWATADLDRQDYLNMIASTLVQRPLTDAELASKAPVNEVVASFVESPRFLDSSRMFVEQLLRSNGTADGVDFDLPGNLMSSITANKQPYSKIITSDTCKDKDGKDIKCDANAPYNAGVLTTRSFLLSHAGPFNISRSNFLLKTFSCLTYPLSPKLEPPLEQTDLIEPFSLTNGKGFGADNGNGTNCYGCHAQFGKHTQLFVKFDRNGLYVADADGIQDPAPNAGSGYTEKLTYVSHLKDQSAAAGEKTQYFGQAVSNLRDAANSIVKNDVFLDCSIRKVLGYYLRLQDSAVDKISNAAIAEIRKELKAEAADPTFQDIVIKSLGNEEVFNAFIKSKE